MRCAPRDAALFRLLKERLQWLLADRIQSPSGISKQQKHDEETVSAIVHLLSFEKMGAAQ